MAKVNINGSEWSMDTFHKFVDGKKKVSALPYSGARPWNIPRNVAKRYDQFNAFSPGYNNGLSVSSYYNAMADGSLVLMPEGKMAIQDPMMIQKSDAPLTTADGGAFNAIFGASAVLQYAQSSNALSSLNQSVWPSSGFRAATTAAHSSGLGIAQSSDRPDTLEPTYVEVPITPKEIAATTELSDVLIVVGETDDSVTFSVNKEVVQSGFMDSWDSDILVDGNTLAGNNFESIDRCTASAATATNLSWTAADEDLYGLDRTSATYFDSNSYDASGTDRFLTRALLDTAIYASMEYWGSYTDRDKFSMITGLDIMPDFEALEEAKQHLTTGNASFGVNGVSTQPGQEVGVVVSKYKGIPLIQDKNVNTDTKSRIYGLNSDYIGMSFGRPLEFLSSDNAFVVGFNKLGLWHAIGEVRCTKPAAHFSIRDLK